MTEPDPCPFEDAHLSGLSEQDFEDLLVNDAEEGHRQFAREISPQKLSFLDSDNDKKSDELAQDMVKPMDAPPVRKVATDYESSEDAANIDTEGGEEEVRINNIGVTKFHGMMGVVVNKNDSEDIKDDDETFLMA